MLQPNEKPVNALRMRGKDVYPAGRSRLRDALDPTSMWITDDEIDHILLICGGHVDRAKIKCILKMRAKASDAHDTPEVIRLRSLHMLVEDGVINV